MGGCPRLLWGDCWESFVGWVDQMRDWGPSWRAYAAMQRGLGRFGRGVAKGVSTVLLFCCIPQAADPLGSCDAEPWEVFADATPEGSGFGVGIVGQRGHL